MSRFLYYIPGGSIAIYIPALQAQGLGYAFDKSLVRREIKGGPDGGDGVIVAESSRLPSELAGYYPDKQTWQKIPGLKGDAWVGYYTDLPPMPEDLARPEQIAGHNIELLDGRNWLIPLALEATDRGGTSVLTNQLPDTLDLNEQGQWIHGRILPRYAEISELADKWFADIMAAMDSGEEQAGGGYALKFEMKSDIFDAAIAVLAANYAIGRVEAAMLNLLTEAKAYQVLNLLVDLPGLVELQKKKKPPLPPL